MISLIAAIGKNNELGKDNALVFHLKEDMHFFKATTMGHPILMGRKTFASIGRPLPGRTNYVLTRHPELLPDGVEPVRELRPFLESWQDTEEELFVIGGASVYTAALPYATNLYLTEIDASRDADAFFPSFDRGQFFRQVIKKGKEDDLAYVISRYIRKQDE